MSFLFVCWQIYIRNTNQLSWAINYTYSLFLIFWLGQVVCHFLLCQHTKKDMAGFRSWLTNSTYIYLSTYNKKTEQGYPLTWTSLQPGASISQPPIEAQKSSLQLCMLCHWRHGKSPSLAKSLLQFRTWSPPSGTRYKLSGTSGTRYQVSGTSGIRC